jgi:hypothetical protein
MSLGAERTGIRLKFWKMKPTRYARKSEMALSLSAATSCPPTKTVPWVGLSIQPMRLSRVVFPPPGARGSASNTRQVHPQRERLQASAQRRPLPVHPIWDLGFRRPAWREQKTGALFPTMSQFPSSVYGAPVALLKRSGFDMMNSHFSEVLCRVDKLKGRHQVPLGAPRTIS